MGCADTSPGWMVEVNADMSSSATRLAYPRRLWELLASRVGGGQTVLVEPVNIEQGWTVRTAGHDQRRPVDYDGLILSARARR
ncbi:type I-E CRISPR-associated endoribonuclease Cas2 [Saccharopolyspora sp. 5N102]|uniref:type I-E CRISPR-associated endoribonuclease Cas2 n=1 Tax=Saccharopolyspora sp. 5N102 TaxID=3375155 RepID=UPI0037A60C03